MSDRFVVLGANGLVGARLCRILAKEPVTVVGLGRGQLTGGVFRYLEADLTRFETLGETLQSARPDVVINCAGLTDVDACENKRLEAWEINAELPARLAEYSRQLGFHLVHVSTDYVFDGEKGPYDVDDLPNPRGVYALTKHAGEQAVKALGGSWTIARTAVVYGWPQANRSNFGAWLVSSLKAAKPVRLFEDQFVSPSLALNVAQMLFELGRRRLTGIWHTAGASVVDRVTFGRALCRVFGFSESLITPSRIADANLASPRPPRCGLKVDRTSSELVARPLALEDSLEWFHAEYRSSP